MCGVLQLALPNYCLTPVCRPVIRATLLTTVNPEICKLRESQPARTGGPSHRGRSPALTSDAQKGEGPRVDVHVVKQLRHNRWPIDRCNGARFRKRKVICAASEGQSLDALYEKRW